MGEPTEAAWAYADNGRILLAFLGTSITLLLIGILTVFAGGREAAVGAGVLLSIATFLLVFAITLFLPRLARRGERSFRLVVDSSIEEVSHAVRAALESVGRMARIDILPSRSNRPPRMVTGDGLPCRFRLEAISLREAGASGVEKTEVIQVGSVGGSGAARELRDLLASRLLGASEEPV